MAEQLDATLSADKLIRRENPELSQRRRSRLLSDSEDRL